MKIAIVETSLFVENPIDAHSRNSKEIHQYLSQFYSVDLMWGDSEVKNYKYDIVLFSYSSFYFQYQRFEEFIEINKNSLVGWITNEYNITPNGCFGKYIKFMISNFEKHGHSYGKKVDYYLMTNLNTLFARKRNKIVDKKYDLIYYGTYRTDREVYFKKYFRDDLILSTSTKNKKKFKILGSNCKVIDKLSFKKYSETLNLFRASLYIEDEFTHDCFNNLANRFYEAVFTNTALFYDKSCKSTIEKSNYVIEDFWFVSSYNEIIDKIRSKEFDIKKEEFLVYAEKQALLEKETCLRELLDFFELLKSNISI